MSDVPKGENEQLEYPKPPGWDWMTDEERWEALRAEPKPDSEGGKKALREARNKAQQAARSEKNAIREARIAALLSDCPRCSLVLDGPPTLLMSDGGYSFRATLKFESDPQGQDKSFVFDARQGLLGDNAPARGFHSVYESEECKPEDRIKFQQIYPLMRKKRGPDGRILSHYKIRSLDGWEELAPNASVSKEIYLKLDASHPLQVGKTYWLRYDMNSGSALTKVVGFGIPKTWKYGTLEASYISLS